MAEPRVLVFIDWYSPGYKAGGPVRSLVNMVDHLRDRVRFHIVTTDTEYTEHVPYTGIVPDRWTTLPGGERVWYASRAGLNMRTWKALLAEGPWDAVYVNGLYSRWFSILPLWLLRGSDQRRIAAPRGMLAQGMLRYGGLKKRAFLTAMRVAGCYRGVEFQATNEEEAADIRRWSSPDRPVRVVPNLARRALITSVPARVKEPGSVRLVSVARIAVEKNTLFAIERLRSLTGEVRFDLYGTIYDAHYWATCQEAIARLPGNIRVEHKGVLEPQHVPEVLRGYHALYMPSSGENFGHALVEALAAGLPLLISDRTPWKDLEAVQAGWDLPLDAPQRFEEVLQRTIDMDQRTMDRHSAAAFAMGTRYLNDTTNIERSFALLSGT